MATKAPAKKKGRRWIDYPRAGRSGLRRWLPSWKLVLGTLLTLIVDRVHRARHRGRDDRRSPSRTTWPWRRPRASTTTTARPRSAGSARPTARVFRWNGSPPQMQAAMLAAEDRGYYSHGGFDPRGLARAAWNNMTGGSVQGASTITQQYAKNAYLSQEQSFSRKFKELVLSVKLETQSSKDEILADYLNTIYYGRGAYGIQAASQAYFGKSASKLDAAESAYLAAIIRAPSFYASKKGQADLRARWDYVVDGMVTTGALTQAEADALVFPEPIPWSGAYNYFKGPNGYLLESARLALLDLGYTDDDINLNGYRVTTTINKQAQDAAIAAVRDYGPTYNTAGPAHRSGQCPTGHRRDRGDVRRQELPAQPAQRRHAVDGAGRIDVQAVRPDRGARAGHRPVLDVGRQFAAHDRGIHPAELRERELRDRHAAQGHGELHQHPVRGTWPAGRNRQRAQGGHQGRRAARHHRAEGRSDDGAGHRFADCTGHGQRLCDVRRPR